MWITKVSIKNPVFASMVMAALLVLGIVSYGRLPVERFPDIASPEVFINLNYPGASPEAIENDLIKPIEDQVNTISGVKHIFATAKEGVGFMQVQFRLDADATNATQELRDKVALIRPSFPREAKDPLIVKADISGETQPVVQLALRSQTRTLRELTTLADQIIAKQLRMVTGVGNVNVQGGVNRQVQIFLHSSQMNSLAVGVDQVIAAIQDANLDTPAGSIVHGRTEQLLRVEGKIKDAKQFGKIIVAREGDAPVYLDQIADVVDGEEERTSISRFNGQPALSLDIVPIQGANIVELGESVKQAVSELQKRLPTDVELILTHANSDDIKNSLEQTKETILEGAMLTILIVFMFLHSWRSTVITALTLPISVVAAFIVVHAFGFSLNMLTLMALSLSIGLLIDDAIVVRENIVRHLGMGKGHIQAALEGTQEIGLAVMATTLAIVVVFVPVAFMNGIIGRFFYQFGITVAVAVLVSLFVSFTLDPMLSSVWEDPEQDRFKYLPWLGRALHRFESVVERVHVVYGRILAWALSNRWKTCIAAFLAFAVSVVVLTPMIGTELMPQTDDGFLFINMNTPVGSSLDFTDAKVHQVEERLKEFKEIQSVQTTVGTGNGKNYAELSLKLTDRHLSKRRSQQKLEEEIRRVVSGIAGIELSVGFNKPIFISVLGPNSGKLSEIANGLMVKIAAIKGIADLESSEKASNPTVAVRINNEAASDLGLTTAQIGRALRPLVSGDTISHWLADDGQNYDVIVRLPQEGRRMASDLGDLYLTSSRHRADGSAQLVPLRQVADFVTTTSPTQLKRLDLQRRISLYANVQGRPSGDVGKEVQALLEKEKGNLPPGYHFETSGQQADMDEAVTAFFGALLLAIIFIYFILASQFASFVQPIVIMCSLPFSLTGVLIALLVTGSTLNIFSMIGFIMLMGLVVKNAILLVDFANGSVRDDKPVHEALLEAGQVRLRPILMTTAAMIFGMLPMAIGAGDGGETQAPMGRAIIGGVITSTILTLVVIPVLYSFLESIKQRLRSRRAAKQAVGQAKDLHLLTPGVRSQAADVEL